MTLGRAASVFETNNPPSGPAAASTTPTVNAVICRYCKGKDHKLADCPKKSQFPIRRGLKNPIRLHLLSPDQLNARDSHVLSVILWITCLTCALVVRKSRGVSLRPTLSFTSSNRKPSVGWGSTKRGWERDDEGSK